MTIQSKLIFDHLGLPTGSLSVTDVHLEHWGGEITLDCLYTYPPEEKPFKLIFKNCTGVQWNVPNTRSDDATSAQMLTHDLGDAAHQRTARVATVLFEVIIAYGQLVVEKGW